MSSPTPEERDPQLIAALEMAVRVHSKKHYNAGVHAGISSAIQEMLSAFSPDDAKKYNNLMSKLSTASHDARLKSLDQKPTPR
jgi:hypothetical protein